MRIAFFGASELGYKCCEAIINSGFNVVGIYTIPQNFKISYSKDKPVKNYLFRDFNSFAEINGIPVIEVEGNMGSYEEGLKELAPDLIVVIGWYYMIPKKLREIAPLGCIGIHSSLLPKYRGGAPLVWAMINGEKEAGLSLFYFDDGVDNGDIIDQQSFSIEPEETIRHVLQKVERIALSMIVENIAKIQSGTSARIVQDETQATYVPQRKPEDGLIDWSWDKDRIKNFIRAQTKPYPGAFFIQGDKKIIIWDADIIDNDPLPSTK